MLVNNEVGTIQDINELVEKVNEIRIKRKQDGNKLPLYVHTDACQAVNYLDISVSRLGVDLLTINSGKIYGPKQCGALFIKSGIILKPIIYGGGQEKGLRSGTENIANCIGFAKALEIADKKRAFESKRLIDIRDKMIQEFKANDIQVNGAKGSKRIANNVHITIEGYDNERLLMELDIRGFMVATGSACSASSDLPSHVLKALGFSDDQSRSSIRITLGRNTDEHSAMQLVQNVIELVAKK
jgi:cysteine desulfurase